MMSSAFDSVASVAVARVFDLFGEQIEIVTSSGTTQAVGIYAQAVERESFGGASVESLDPTVELRAASVGSADLAEGDVIRVRGGDFTVVSLSPTDDDTLLATLRAYAG